MARTNIDVVITVRDSASKPLDNVAKKVKATGKAAKDASVDFVQFNKTLFTTAAFIGTFVKGFTTLRSSIEFGAELDKATDAFERQMGPRGVFINALQKSSNVVVDEMTALHAGLKLGSLGVAKSSEDAAQMVSKLAVVAKLAGKDSTKGIEDLTSAMIDGNVAKFEEYNLIRKTDPAYMALIATMNKAGGVYGNLFAKQTQIALIMGLVNKKTRDQMFSFMSLGQVVEYTGKAFTNLRYHVGILLGNAVRPLLEKLIPLLTNFKEIIYNIYKTDKHTMFLVKSFLAATAAVTGLIATFGSLKLMVKLLGFAGFGFPGITAAVLGLSAAFVGLTRASQDPLEKLKIFGAFFKGIYELVTNFDPETGLSKISESTKKLLGDSGIYGIVKFISATVVTIRTTVKDVIDSIKFVGKVVDKVFGGMFSAMNTLFEKIMPAWSTWWTTDALSPVKKFARASMVILGGLALFFGAKGLFGGILSKIPVIGKFFGGGGSGPKGTASDPIYTRSADGAIGGLLGGLAGGGKGGVFKSLFDILKQSYKLGGWRQILKDIPTAFSLVFPRLASVLGSVGGVLTRALAAAAPLLGPALGIAAAAAVGVAIGKVINIGLDKFTQGRTEEGFEGNLVERGFFKLDKMFGGQTSKDFIKNQKAFEANMSASPSKQTSASVPLPEDLDIIESVGSKMQSMNEADRTRMQTAMEQALATQGPSGKFIDPEEFKNFENLMVNALDSSENLTTLANKAKENRLKSRQNVRESF